MMVDQVVLSRLARDSERTLLRLFFEPRQVIERV
jgi:hypothetical protein